MPNDFGIFYDNLSDAGMLFSFAHPKSWKIIFLTSYLKILLDNLIRSPYDDQSLQGKLLDRSFDAKEGKEKKLTLSSWVDVTTRNGGKNLSFPIALLMFPIA